MLDEASPEWRQQVTQDTDLGELLKTAYGLTDAGELTREIKDKYGYAEIYEKEAAVRAEKDRLIAEYTEKFTASSILTLKLEFVNIGFQPATLQPLPDLGTAYPNIELISDCGSLSVTDGGCLLSDDFKQAVVSAEGIESVTSKIYSVNLFDFRKLRQNTIMMIDNLLRR